jgi:dTDP-4-dehydrorhamnose reductase
VTSWLVTGGGGQLAHHLVELLRDTGAQVAAPPHDALDITDAAQIESAIAEHRPDVLINTAAYTAVDAAEEDEPRADLVNRVGPGLLATALGRSGGRLIQISTDYVFAGDATSPYQVDAPVGPTGAYGRTKLAGEQAVRAALPDRAHVVRTAWLYGGPGPNFVDTMLRLEGERDTVDVVADQVGSPTWARDLAAALIELGTADVEAGVLHYVNSGQASWFDLAREAFRLAGADPERVRPVDTAAFPRPAPRPAWSVLSTDAWIGAGLTAPRPWPDALADALARSHRAR